MKLFIKTLALVVVLNAGAWITPQEASAQVSVSFQLFYDELSPYGSWVEYQNYGYVWVPDVDREFSPYGTDGHWVFTDNGWAWVSDYSWGWAPFHYGRWAYDDSYGWLWVPHNEWGPAWVSWRRSPGYYGWAPMGPGISVEVSIGGGYRVPNERWIFVSDRDINRPDINRYYVDRSTNVTIIYNSTVINNTYFDNSRNTKYVAGPDRDDVQKVTGAAIRPVTIRENDRPGQTLSNDQLQIYRPRVQTSNTNDRKPAPSKLVNLKEVKPVSERRQGNQRRNENLPAKGKEQSSQPQNAKPPDNKVAGEQPRIVIPPDKNKIVEEPSQPANADPPGNKVAGEQPRIIIPPDKNKMFEELPPQPQDVKPFDKKGRDQQPRVFNSIDTNKNNEQPLGKQAAKPFGKKGKGQQPRIFNPIDTSKNIDQQSKSRDGRSRNKKSKGRDPQPPKSDKQ